MASPSLISSNDDSPVAICTLSSFDLQHEIATSSLAASINLIGPLETENVGIERMLTTLIEHPRIRWLVVCGDENRGRYQSQALFSLFEHGLSDDGKIAGARGKRARIRTLSADHIAAAQRQVTLVNLTGEHDISPIARAVEACLASDPGLFTETVESPKPAVYVVPEVRFRLKEHDPNGFFVIEVDHDGGQLLVEHYEIGGKLIHRLGGADAESLCVALVDWGLVSRLDHAAYLGRELTKAEAALRSGTPYRQDETSAL